VSGNLRMFECCRTAIRSLLLDSFLLNNKTAGHFHYVKEITFEDLIYYAQTVEKL
jgi:hypothetical protein